MIEEGSSGWRTTAWSMILGAQGAGEERQHCLERLCTTYWKPSYYYARRRGLDHHAATDCVQDFFARMLAGNWIDTLDRERGSFRGWMHTALKRWIGRTRSATGADRFTVVSDDAVRAYEGCDPQADPDTLYNRAWAQSCLDEALRLMRAEQAGTSRERQVAVFCDYLRRTAAADGTTPAYEELATAWGLPVSTITNYLHRARSLFRSYLLRVVRDTLADPEAAEHELAQLRQHLEQS